MIFSATFGLWTTPAAARDPAWPTWPTEVDRIAAPLHAGTPAASEHGRAAAVQGLADLAPEVALPHLSVALQDPSLQVRRDALRVCDAQRAVACAEPALALLRADREPSLRAAALRVIALDPTGPRLAALLEALRDPSETLRAEAAEAIALAPVRAEDRPEVVAALLAKLPDASAVVRRQAIGALGLLGDDGVTLSLTRMLEDAEPAVQGAAATALGRLHDDRAIAALRRVLDLPTEPPVVAATVAALADLGGDEIEALLLEWLDEPPKGLDPRRIAMAIGSRSEPGPTLVQGLVARLDEPDRQSAAALALRLLGEPARAGLEAALDQGASAPRRAALEALLGQPLVQAPRGPAWPGTQDRGAWQRRLSQGDLHARVTAGVALGRRSPPWLADRLRSALRPTSSPRAARPWLFALAASPNEVDFGRARVPVAILEGWAHDPEHGDADRCVSIAALASVRARRGDVDEILDALAADARPSVRACAALASARRPSAARLAALLADPSARVRVAAVLAAPLGAPFRGRLALLQASDPRGEVRRAAAFALDHRRTPNAATFAWQIPDTRPWLSARFAWLERDDARVAVPVLGDGDYRWLWLPGHADLTPEIPESLLQIQSSEPDPPKK